MNIKIHFQFYINLALHSSFTRVLDKLVLLYGLGPSSSRHRINASALVLQKRILIFPFLLDVHCSLVVCSAPTLFGSTVFVSFVPIFLKLISIRGLLNILFHSVCKWVRCRQCSLHTQRKTKHRVTTNLQKSDSHALYTAIVTQWRFHFSLCMSNEKNRNYLTAMSEENWEYSQNTVQYRPLCE